VKIERVFNRDLFINEIKNGWYNAKLDEGVSISRNNLVTVPFIDWLDKNGSGRYYWQLEVNNEDATFKTTQDLMFELITENGLWFELQDDFTLFQLTWR